MKKLRVMVLMDEELVPPESIAGVSDEEMLNWKTEYDVLVTLRDLGHQITPLGVSDDLGVVRKTIEEMKAEGVDSPDFFIEKPIDPELVIGKIRELIGE